MYPAGTPTAALLETVFHDRTEVDPVDRIVSERGLLKKLLAHVTAPHKMRVLDLRDRSRPARASTAANLSPAPPCTTHAPVASPERSTNSTRSPRD